MGRRQSGAIVCRPVACEAELQECLRIRRHVFVEEQHLFSGTDADARDARAIHIAAFCGGVLVGTVRVFPQRNGLWWGGRLAVEKPYRGRAGRLLVAKAVEIVKLQGGRRFLARVQARNLAFFKSLHWKTVGKAFYIGGTLHQICEADLG